MKLTHSLTQNTAFAAEKCTSQSRMKGQGFQFKTDWATHTLLPLELVRID